MKLNPKQQLAWASYVDPSSPTFGNASGSCQTAGYTDHLNTSQSYWWVQKCKQHRIAEKAEKALEEALDLDHVVTVSKINKEGEHVERQKTSVSLLKVKVDVAKFCSERLNRDTYSTRQEITGADGGPIETVQELDAQTQAELAEFVAYKKSQI